MNVGLTVRSYVLDSACVPPSGGCRRRSWRRMRRQASVGCAARASTLTLRCSTTTACRTLPGARLMPRCRCCRTKLGEFTTVAALSRGVRSSLSLRRCRFDDFDGADRGRSTVLSFRALHDIPAGEVRAWPSQPAR